jgi:hypothetical protein
MPDSKGNGGDRKCKGCIYSSPMNALQIPPQLICRRYPPSVIPHAAGPRGGVAVTGFFPPVQPDGWCGEFAYGMMADTKVHKADDV